ncbi:DUF4271 domain-containing protein [Bacteroides sp. 51]|uniref:DUF4271 domain-containing protein n=1 Tax=Bacteroides sp. 51 TaxID=2302938 RepID=UPI0013D101A7|nr:DUF4271 domain-containing protein [Bacteroides sp. 51]NDV80687.1 DUF4271 domain-containing protein [Bacteroides sp. 51]
MMNIPIPYTPKADDGIAIILLCCFFLSAFVLAKTKKFLWQQGNNFILHKDRTSIFSSSTATDVHYLLLLVLQTCILSGICFFNYFDNDNPLLVQQIHPYLLLGTYTGVCLVYIILKWLMYSFLGWVFLDRGVTDMWLESYSTIIYYLGFALFPFVLFLVYFDLNTDIMVIIGLGFIILAKLLIFYKWLKFFFNNIYGLLLLILYFCALEIIPCFIYYQVLIKINSLLLLKI